MFHLKYISNYGSNQTHLFITIAKKPYSKDIALGNIFLRNVHLGVLLAETYCKFDGNTLLPLYDEAVQCSGFDLI